MGSFGLVARGGLRGRGGGRRRAAARPAGAGLALRLRPGRSTGPDRSRPAGRPAPPSTQGPPPRGRATAPRPIRKVGLVGAGLMAAQLATLFLRRLEVPVAMRDLSSETLAAPRATNAGGPAANAPRGRRGA